MDTKEQVRTAMRRARAALGPDERAARASAATDLLIAIPEVGRAGTILVFYAFGSELATAGLIRRLAGAGARVLLPRLTPAGIEAARADALAPTTYGPKEPTGPPVPPEEIDVVVVPGLAFDRSGHRLGYGGGHYDRFLPRLRADAVAIGFGFAFQVLEELPTDPWDAPVDVVVTDERVIDTRGKGARPPPL